MPKADTSRIKDNEARLLILGANGRLGLEVITAARARGARVTAFVRNTGAIQQREGVDIVIGDVTSDSRALATALSGHDALISALGNPLWLKGLKGPAIVEAAFRNAVLAMRQANVGRFIAPLAWGTGASLEKSSLIIKLVAAALFRRDYRDFSAAERLVTTSDIDWTIAYFGALTAGPASGAWDASAIVRTPKNLAIARADLADFLVGSVLDRKFLRQHVVLSGAG